MSPILRSSNQRCSIKKMLFKNFCKIRRKTLGPESLFLNKVADLGLKRY